MQEDWSFFPNAVVLDLKRAVDNPLHEESMDHEEWLRARHTRVSKQRHDLISTWSCIFDGNSVSHGFAI